MDLRQTINMCVKNVLSNKLRSLLSMLGIIIGISSVIILVGITKGTKENINSNLQNLGANVLTIKIYNDDSDNLTYKEIKNEEFNFANKYLVTNQSRVMAKNKSSEGTYTLIGSTLDLLEVHKLDLSEGRDIADLDVENNSNVAIIGSEVASNLFDGQDVVGEKIYLNSNYYTVVGILSSKSSSNTDYSSSIIVPITSYSKTLSDDTISNIYFVGDEKLNNTFMMERMATASLTKYISSENIEAVTQDSISSTISEIDTTTSLLISLIGVVALTVSGIGVMNIMIVSVSERTREIGVRKAIGATDFDILKQFLIESILITTFGGILGVIVGLVSKLLADIINVSFVFDVEIALISLGFAAFIGVVFGIIPAIRASKLKPIEALKYE